MRVGVATLVQYLLLLAIGLVVWGYVQSRAEDLRLHNQRLDLLLRLERVEGSLDRDILQVASFQLLQYDPLVRAQRELREVLAQVEASEGAAQQTAALSADYRRALDAKLDLLEHIKSRAALVRNGLLYLPLAAADLHLDPVANLLNDLLRYNLLPGTLEAEDLAVRLEALDLLSDLGPDERPLLDNLLHHMRANLGLTAEVQALREAYLEVPTDDRLADFYRAFQGQYEAQTRWAERVSLLLLALTVVLFAGLGVAIRRLAETGQRAERAWTQLRDAVESLSEAFALFDPQGRLVLHNGRYRAFYPWLAGTLAAGPTLARVLEGHRAHDAFAPDGPPGPRDPETLTGGYLEHLRDGRWYLASDTRTSTGETACVRVDVTQAKRAEAQLTKLYRAIEQSPASVLITDAEGCIEYVNPKFEEVTGYCAAEVLGQNPRILKSGDKSPADYKDLWDTLTAGQVWRGQFHNRRKDGTIFWESASISPVRDAQGRTTHFIAVKEDITVRKRVEDQLRMNATIFDTISEGIMVTGSDNRIKTVNPAFSRITGYEVEEVIGRRPSLLASGRHDAGFYEEMWRALLTGGYWSGEVWNRRKDGSVYPEWLSLAAIRDAQGQIQEYVGVFSDITRRKENEEQIRRQANYDALTGLPNRTLLVDRLDRAMAAAHRERTKVGLLFIDLDRFKGVNDSLGHVVGDELLQQVARRLLAGLRETDTVARFGGDEFVVVLEGLHQASEAAQVAKTLIAAVGVPFELAGREIFIGASVGVTLYPDDSIDADTMLRNADMAMYRAKDAGRNTCEFFTLTMNEEVQARIDLERDLRQALEQGALHLDYQPIVASTTGRMVGVEALLRWRRPGIGLVPPDLFIPLAEETGLIAPIGHWVLQQAFAQCAQWGRAGLGIRVNVNLSSRQLALGLDVEELRALLMQAGAEPGSITLEITETLMLDGTATTEAWLQAVRGLGLGLAVDDFGTGYSSLSYLKRYPMDTLKIDRSFVQGLPGDREDVSLVQAILALARSLGLRVVAEGVETQAQRAFLSANGCDYMQGWLFSRAVSAGAIPDLAARDWPGRLAGEAGQADCQRPDGLGL